MSRFLTGIMNTENKVLGVIVGFIVYNKIRKVFFPEYENVGFKYFTLTPTSADNIERLWFDTGTALSSFVKSGQICASYSTYYKECF